MVGVGVMVGVAVSVAVGGGIAKASIRGNTVEPSVVMTNELVLIVTNDDAPVVVSTVSP